MGDFLRRPVPVPKEVPTVLLSRLTASRTQAQGGGAGRGGDPALEKPACSALGWDGAALNSRGPGDILRTSCSEGPRGALSWAQKMQCPWVRIRAGQARHCGGGGWWLVPSFPWTVSPRPAVTPTPHSSSSAPLPDPMSRGLSPQPAQARPCPPPRPTVCRALWSPSLV